MQERVQNQEYCTSGFKIRIKKAGRRHFGNGGRAGYNFETGIEIEIVTTSTEFRHEAAFTILVMGCLEF